ncbi:MAG: hypothetical protein PHR44_05760 [Candidatus Omnitrophica bacterium]|nr:hypothetical protein [Candidatus Omnitrophota bacterium]
MKSSTRILFFICIFHLSLFTFSSFAGIPREISYQGRLTDKDGKPLAEGIVTITFRLYTTEGGGSAIWSDTKSVPVSNGGIFSTTLGPFPEESVKFDQPYWLGIQIPPDAEMTPRQKLTAAGYAVRAESANMAERAIIRSDSNDTAGALYLSDKVDNNTIEVGSGNLRVKQLFGSWASKSSDTVYQALTDGFVLAQRTNQDNRNELRGYTDSGNPPTTQRMIVGNTTSPEGDHKFEASIMFPVRKNDYWKVIEADVVYWIPIGN